MKLLVIGKVLLKGELLPAKSMLVMKLTAIVMLGLSLQLSARSFSQKVTISGNDLSWGQLFKAINKQTGYAFMYGKDALVNTPFVSVHCKDATLEEVLDQCFKGEPFSYVIVNK